MRKNKKFLIIAGNYQQFKDWCYRMEQNPIYIGLYDKEYVPDEFLYYTDEMCLCGQRDIVDIFTIGTWYERKDIDMDEIKLKCFTTWTKDWEDEGFCLRKRDDLYAKNLQKLENNSI